MADRSDIAVLIGNFRALHKLKFGVDYMISYGKDQKIMAQIIGTYGVAKTAELVESFFKEFDKDEFLKKAGASVGVFKTQIPKLIVNTTKKAEDNQIGRL